MQHKIGVITDIHGNSIALKVILDYFNKIGVDEIIHTGDIVDIGPNAKECYLMLKNTPNVTMLLGNHDRDFATNNSKHKELSHVSEAHKKYVFKSMDGYQEDFSKFPLFVTRDTPKGKLLFCHYAFNKVDNPLDVYPFKTIANEPTAEIFDELFDGTDAIAVFFGHKHEPTDITGKRVYVDVGSVGCHKESVSRGVVATIDDKGWNYERIYLPYDRERMKQEMLSSALPDSQYMFDFYFDKLYSNN